MDDWSLNPATFAYGITWRPPQYVVPCLMSSWEFYFIKYFLFYTSAKMSIGRTSRRQMAHRLPPQIWYTTIAVTTAFGAFSNPVNAAIPSGAILTSLTSTSTTLVFQFNITNPETILETMLVTAVNNLEINPAAVQPMG